LIGVPVGAAAAAGAAVGAVVVAAEALGEAPALGFSAAVVVAAAGGALVDATGVAAGPPQAASTQAIAPTSTAARLRGGLEVIPALPPHVGMCGLTHPCTLQGFHLLGRQTARHRFGCLGCLGGALAMHGHPSLDEAMAQSEDALWDEVDDQHQHDTDEQ
jgi:hypothetical protein